jgi:hypothetical protein
MINSDAFYMFYEIEKYASEHWKGNLTEKELIEYTCDLYSEWEEVYKTGSLDVGGNLDYVIETLVEDYNNGADEVYDWLDKLSWDLEYSGADDLIKAYS